MLSYVASFVDKPENVLLAFGITSALVLTLVCIGFLWKKDITYKLNLLVFCFWALISIIFLSIFFDSYLANLIYSLIVIFIFSFYLVFDI